MEPSATPERRAFDRRGADRRRGERRSGGAGRRREDHGLDSFFDPGWLAAGDRGEDSRLPWRAAPPAAEAPEAGSALARVVRTYVAARAAIGVGLVIAFGVGEMLGLRSVGWAGLVAVGYAVQAITLWLLPRFDALLRAALPSGQRKRQWWVTIGIDLAAFTLLHALEPSGAFNFAALLVLPVLMAGVLSSRLLALGTAASVALLLLVVVAWRGLIGGEIAPSLMLQAGLAGMGFFVITLLAGELAGRLAREEQAARGSLELARQQAQLNRLVIEEMADGVLVVDAQLRVRAANPAARALLVDQGLGPAAPFTLLHHAPWTALAGAVQLALAEGDWPEAGRDVRLVFEPGVGSTRTLRLRVRFMRRRELAAGGDSGAPEPFAVLLLEDLRTLQARIRQEKLAAMGRVSAGIAHEIRNPLAAISQANALLLEDEPAPAQARLLGIVADNVARLKRLVDDVTEVAPGIEPASVRIDAREVVAGTVREWARTAGLPLQGTSRLRCEWPESELPVLFDAEHLRRVLVNLLDNASRHASAEAGSMLVLLGPRDESAVRLAVLSDGAPITPEVERHLFEPFFSTRSRGSGLGLFICRELCERHGASIEYRPRPAAERLRNEFLVVLRRAGSGAEPRPVEAELPRIHP